MSDTTRRLTQKQIKSSKQRIEAKRKKQERSHLQYQKDVLENRGLYRPTSDEITKSRASTIRKKFREFAEILDPSKFLYVKAPKPALKKAKAADLTISREGIFIKKGLYKKAVLREDKKRGEYVIARLGSTRYDEDGNRIGAPSDLIPLADLSELTSEDDRLRRTAKKLGALKEGEVYVFKIKERGREASYSRNMFTDIDLLLKQLANYKRSTELSRVQLMRHVTIEKWSLDKAVAARQARLGSDVQHSIKRKERRVNSRRGKRKGRGDV